jgi:hypothetical protein
MCAPPFIFSVHHVTGGPFFEDVDKLTLTYQRSASLPSPLFIIACNGLSTA